MPIPAVGLRPLSCLDCGFEFYRAAWVSVTCDCCVLSGIILCVGLITRPEEFYRVRCVGVWLWRLDSEEALAPLGAVKLWKRKYHPTVYILCFVSRQFYNFFQTDFSTDCDLEFSISISCPFIFLRLYSSCLCLLIRLPFTYDANSAKLKAHTLLCKMKYRELFRGSKQRPSTKLGPLILPFLFIRGLLPLLLAYTTGSNGLPKTVNTHNRKNGPST